MKDAHFKWFSLAVALAAALFLFLTGCKGPEQKVPVQSQSMLRDTGMLYVAKKKPSTTPGHIQVTDSTIKLTPEDWRISSFPNEIDSSDISPRFFLVSYETEVASNRERVYGSELIEVSDGRFPSQKLIEKDFFSRMPMPQSCYRHLILQNIFEFKSYQDYEDFGRGFGKSDPIIKHKTPCK
jgi:hypothetical protein